MPSKQEEVVTTKTAPIRMQEPAQRLLDRVSDPNAPEIDGFAPGATHEEQGHRHWAHDLTKFRSGFCCRCAAASNARPMGSMDLILPAGRGPARLFGRPDFLRCPYVGL